MSLFCGRSGNATAFGWMSWTPSRRRTDTRCLRHRSAGRSRAVIWDARRKLWVASTPVSYTHLRAHETRHDLVCRLLLEKKKRNILKTDNYNSVNTSKQEQKENKEAK